ncbi:hypothetical protein BDW71DRAFT_183041 [Aspergillus fruticulosus]
MGIDFMSTGWASPTRQHGQRTLGGFAESADGLGPRWRRRSFSLADGFNLLLLLSGTKSYVLLLMGAFRTSLPASADPPSGD